MTDPVVQRLFDTPIIRARLDDAVVPGLADATEGLVATIISLADRYTVDVAQSAAPRFAWRADVTPVRSGEIAAAACFWLAAVCVRAGGDDALVVHDPRSLIRAATHPDWDFAEPGQAPQPATQRIAAQAGAIVMVPGVVRLTLERAGGSEWLAVALRPRRV